MSLFNHNVGIYFIDGIPQRWSLEVNFYPTCCTPVESHIHGDKKMWDDDQKVSDIRFDKTPYYRGKFTRI